MAQVGLGASNWWWGSQLTGQYPYILNAFPLGQEEARYICLSSDGRYAYLTQTGDRVFVVGISQPGSETLVGQYQDLTNLGGPGGCAVSGTNLFVACGTPSMTVVNVANPAAPSTLTALSNGAFVAPGNLVISGTHAYMSDTNTIFVIDISTPSTPSVVTSLTDNTYLAGVSGMQVVGNYIWCSCNGYITAVNITTPGSPSVAGHVAWAGGSAGSWLSVNGTTLAAISYAGSYLFLFSIATPSSPSALGSVNVAPSTLGVALGPQYAYTVHQTTSSNFNTIDCSNTAAPTVVATISDATRLYHTFNVVTATTQGSLLAYCVVAGSGYFTVVDLGPSGI